MARYIGKRLIISVITIFILITVVFFLLRSLPGDPFSATTMLQKELIEKLRDFYGLDRPLWEQYVNYMKNLLQGELGYSMQYTNRTVTGIIKDSFPVSASLGLRALAVGWPCGILLGIVAARKRGKALDYICIFISIAAVSVPSFILATLLQYLFGVKLGILPVAQWKGFAYTILPVFSMAFGMLSSARGMRAYMLEVTSQDYIKTAKAKGVPERRLIWRHMFRNAMLPIVTGLGPMVAGILTGTFVIESIFVIPGLGSHFTKAIKGLDYTMAMGLVIFYSIFLVFANFMVDIGYVLVDPRVRITD